MASKKLSAFSANMRRLDICMLTTQTVRGTLNSRPMSNNGDVEYDGNSYFFSYKDSSAVKDIAERPLVNLAFEGPKDLYIAVAGTAKIIRSRAKLEEHWQPQLKRWFEKGIDTPGIVMIQVKAKRIKYWQKEKMEEIKL